MTKISTAAFLSLLFLLATDPTASRCAQGFVAGSVSPQTPTTSGSTSSTWSSTGTTTSSAFKANYKHRPAFVSWRGGETTSTTTFSTSATKTELESEIFPSWEDLESELEKLQTETSEKKEKPVLTLYRDTNGWCPFCERVWVAIRAKGLPYQETLVPLQGKPEWYKQMVPTGLVPAVLFHGEDQDDESNEAASKAATSRELVWESDAILEALDQKFPETVQLMKRGDPAFEAALQLHDRVQSAGVKFAYGNRNETATEEDLQAIRHNFELALDDLDAALGEQQALTGSFPCFRLGTEFSGMDAIMIPTLERWRYQLTLTENLDILKGRKHLKNWFDAMDSFEAYSGRVAGDEYSWTATASMFLRYFGGGEDKPKVKAGIARADQAAEDLAKEFVATSLTLNDQVKKQAAALEAAAKLIGNHAAVVADCVKTDPLSQQHIPRATESTTTFVDGLLRHVSWILLQIAASNDSSSPSGSSFLLKDCNATTMAQGALALRTVSKRLCVPRDMGGPSAALLRGILSVVADALLDEEEPQQQQEEQADATLAA